MKFKVRIKKRFKEGKMYSGDAGLKIPIGTIIHVTNIDTKENDIIVRVDDKEHPFRTLESAGKRIIYNHNNWGTALNGYKFRVITNMTIEDFE